MRLKNDLSVISVIFASLQGNTKIRESTRSWLIRCDYSIIVRIFFNFNKKQFTFCEIWTCDIKSSFGKKQKMAKKKQKKANSVP